MLAYTNHGKTASVNRSSGWKITQLLQHRWQQNWICIHLEDPVSTKTVQHELHKSNTHGMAATAKPLIIESTAQMHKWWCHDHKIWTSDNWKRMCDMVRWVVLHVVPYIRKSLGLENTQGGLTIWNAWFQQWDMGRFCDGLGWWYHGTVFC
jgi:hypothetical protein